MSWRLPIAAWVLCVASAGCDHVDNPSLEYFCSDSSHLTVTYFKAPGAGRAEVEVGDVTYELPRVMVASGARFSDGKNTWYETGGKAEFLLGASTIECVEVP
jgi:membrane-bound inhibitor of C-type lysozyme